ncbi:MAG: DUF1800 family protein [Synechococcus sp.]
MCPSVRARTRCRVVAAQRLQEAWLERLAFGLLAAQASEVQRWSGIFPVSWRQLPHAALLRQQLASIEAHLSGSFTDLLTAMVLDPALQISLNGPANHRGNPNENLARELLELFSLGEGHYGEADVKEAARALTGYRLDREGRLLLDPRRHDPGPKTILGRTDRFDGASLAAWLRRQPATARHILGRVWRQRIGPLPAPARLEALAAEWRRQDLSLPWLRSTLGQIPEGAASRGRRLDDPITVVARSLALLGSPHPDALRIARVQLAAMGQPLLEPPSVKGWPVDAEWINLRWLQARRRGLLVLLGDEEVWSGRTLGPELPATLTPLPPLTLSLLAEASREMVALLFADPVWQLA